MIKLCPMSFNEIDNDYVCIYEKCAWWVQPYSTENIKQPGMCAIVMIAMKNSEGLFRV